VKPGKTSSVVNFETLEDFRLYSSAYRISRQYLLAGKPLLAATALLAVNDTFSAASMLLHCGELLWAVAVGDSPLAFEAFARYAIGKGTVPAELPRHLVPLIHFDSRASRDAFYRSRNMKSSTEYLQKGRKSRGAARVQLLVLSGEFAEAVDAGLQYLREILAKPAFDFCEAATVCPWLENSCDPNAEVVAVSFYLAVYRAMWRGYHQIVAGLTATANSLIALKNITWLAAKSSEMSLASSLTVSSAFCSNGGSTIVPISSPGRLISIDAPALISYCSGVLITGEPFILEDGRTAFTRQEALMWFEVTPFSPLPSHVRLFPFFT
jgi:hypothetical protein